MFLILKTSISFSQQEENKINKLTLKQFYSVVYVNHPLAKQSRLIVDNAKSMQLAAKGNFDPKLFYQFNDKLYNDKNYYQLSNGGLSIPTRYGVEFKTGYEQNEGVYLNPENNTPAKGLYYTQISLPLVQGLMTDERRTILKQSQINVKASQAELDFQLNELFYKAGKSYLEWQLSYMNLSIYREALELAKQRFLAMKKSSELGDRPSIDTVESGILVLDRLASWQQAEMEFKNKSIQLSGFLWMENNSPAILDSAVVPDLSTIASQQNNLTNQNELTALIDVHPNIRAGIYKLEILNVEKKLKMEKLKPAINLNYNPLFDAGKSNLTFFNNYKWGFTVNFPLFLRKERGELASAKLKIQQSQLELDYKRNEIANKMKISENEMRYSKNQLDIYRENIINYKSLWQAEKRLFENGESSLFMINSRENAYINAQLKLNDYSFKYNKSILEFDYSKGQLTNLVNP
jgi:outer membrane protein TolC